MSWLDTINDKLIITTGDGKQYNPLWKNARRVQEFNIAEFDFINVDGTLVRRFRPKGMKYNFEIHFTGEDHISVAKSFEVSARDSRPWDIIHPIYGRITVQPSALEYNQEAQNVTSITGTVMETITEDNPRTSVIPIDKITSDKENLDIASGNAFTLNTKALSSSDKQLIQSTQTAYYSQAAVQVSDTTQAEEFLNLYNAAQSAMIEATNEPHIAISKMQAFLNYPPSLVNNSVSTRFKLLGDQFTALSVSLDTLLTKNQKEVYQATAGSFIANMATAAANPAPGNYFSRTQVFSVIELFLYYYNLFIEYLDSLQNANGGNPVNFIPDATTLMQLNDLVNYTISNLFNIALNSKQERSLYLEEDSNPVVLTHRFYGLDPETNIEMFIQTNNLGLNELLQIRKGRRIVYYV